MPTLGGWEIVILLGVLVLVFGAKRLPDMARSMGQSARVFKGEMKGRNGDDAPEDVPARTTTTASGATVEATAEPAPAALPGSPLAVHGADRRALHAGR